MPVTPGIQSVDKVPALVRTNFTLENKISFPAGGIADQKPIINLVMSRYPATERIDTYFDIGATDSSGDLDDIDSSTLRVLYKDPAFVDGNFETTGVLAPKAVLMRCLAGSGFVYLNANPSLLGVDANKQAPLTLHAGVGLFYYAFPKVMPHFSKAEMPGGDLFTTSIALLTIHLRTVEDANRFQLIIFK